MANLLTQTERIFPVSAGNARYTWRATHGGEVRTSIDTADASQGEPGDFATMEEAVSDLQSWLHDRRRFSLPMPDGPIQILRHQPEIVAIVRVG